MKRRILLVDDEPAILLTLKALLEIHGFEVETASSARDAKSKLRTATFQMVITDLRMESDQAGLEVTRAAKAAPYQPAVALLTAFPTGDEGWRDDGADEMLVKPMNSQALIRQLEALLVAHEDRKRPVEKVAELAAAAASRKPRKTAGRSVPARS
ncbi:MAG: response regulator [Acidobacteriales bacterium]|nr:response regulator [Terriglobales bacterium]